MRVRRVSALTQIQLKNGREWITHGRKRTRVRLGRRVGPTFLSSPIQTNDADQMGHPLELLL